MAEDGERQIMSSQLMSHGPQMWDSVVRFLKSLVDWYSTFSGLILPALIGAAIGVFSENEQHHPHPSKKKLIRSIILSAVCGCGLTPLLGHFLNIPGPIAASLAFFLGIWGFEIIEVIQNAIRSRVGNGSDEKKNDEEDGR